MAAQSGLSERVGAAAVYDHEVPNLRVAPHRVEVEGMRHHAIVVVVLEDECVAAHVRSRRARSGGAPACSAESARAMARVSLAMIGRIRRHGANSEMWP